MPVALRVSIFEDFCSIKAFLQINIFADYDAYNCVDILFLSMFTAD